MLFEEEYRKKGIDYKPKHKAIPKDFIGTGLVALQRQNISKTSEQINIPNITKPYEYCVTEKADGMRHLLFINSIGHIYLLNMNMKIMFSGAVTENDKCFNTIIDGELILHDKKGEYINMFMAFDIYYMNLEDIRHLPFMEIPDVDKSIFKNGTRLEKMKNLILSLNPKDIVSIKNQNVASETSPITIKTKKFTTILTPKLIDGNIDESKLHIFNTCKFILYKIRAGMYPYNTDGLIFTPTLLGVGGDKISEVGPKKMKRWNRLFKWKPSEPTDTFPTSFNTIDFLVFTKKSTNGEDIVTPIFENGIDMISSNQYNSYKTLELAIGFNPARDGYINPCQDVLDDKITVLDDESSDNKYSPKRFYPTTPYDTEAGITNIMLRLDSNGDYNMFTEEQELIEDQTVVEFRYDNTKQGNWKWVPLRVRYDKTYDYKQGLNSFGNDYVTANNTWYSIHNPVTEQMITTGIDIPPTEISDDVYYNSNGHKLTSAMRDFHNLYVKKKLIMGVSKTGDTLIDFGCGKGGDFPKWIAAKLSFVFGIDVKKDNLENRLNGICARFLNFKKENKNTPWGLFVTGDASNNIRDGTNMYSEKSNAIVNYIFGNVGKDSEDLGPAVRRQYGKGVNGFDISSMQFAMHYMFKDKHTFYNFMRNVAECTKLNGYFISTCYDGSYIFNMLSKIATGENKDIYIDDKKVWSVRKNYSSSHFNADDSSLGFGIDIYQDSINQTLTEWLVNFEFLTNTMEKYGFILLPNEDAIKMGLPSGSGMFSELFNLMEKEVDKNPIKNRDYKESTNMQPYEKTISFMNRYYVYKKIRTIDADKLTKIMLGQLEGEMSYEAAGTLLAQEAVKRADTIVAKKTKKATKTDKAVKTGKQDKAVKTQKVKKLTKKIIIED